MIVPAPAPDYVAIAERTRGYFLWLTLHLTPLIFHWLLTLDPKTAYTPWLIVPHLYAMGLIVLHDYRVFKTVFTPAAIMCLLNAMIVLMPMALNDASIFTVLRVRPETFISGSWMYLVFIVVTGIVYMWQRRGVIQEPAPVSGDFLDRGLAYFGPLAWITGVLALILALSLILIGGVNIIAWALNPFGSGEFEAARRSGASMVVNLLIGGCNLMAVCVAICAAKKRWKELGIGLGIMLASTALIGTKSIMFFPLLAAILLYGFCARTLKAASIIKIIVAVVVMLPLSFLWRGNANPATLLADLADYNSVFHFASRASTEVKVNPGYFKPDGLLLYLVPRAIWSGKPKEISITSSVLDYRLISWYLPENRSVATMGLAEAWAAFGMFGMVFSGIVCGLGTAYVTRTMASPRSFMELTFGTFIVMQGYYQLRVGFLTTFWYQLGFTLAIAWVARWVVRRQSGEGYV